ncbi:P-loop containing nucleoside triphosphate hydrolase protein [Lanmaoa asiatica]|nr:P-loop containing nucleoside triphosphate hydrolase protein [Lanmaoa asiatica]
MAFETELYIVMSCPSSIHLSDGAGPANLYRTRQKRSSLNQRKVLACSVFAFSQLQTLSHFFQPVVVGLTGGIATGKSTVAALFASHDIPVIDADLIARQVVEPGTRGHKQIVKAFGEAVLSPHSVHLTRSGSTIDSDEQDWRTRPIDRKKLGSIIFNDEKQRKILNGIVHPAVTRAIFWGVIHTWLRGEKMVVVDVPLLIEGGLWKWMGRVVVVYWYVGFELARLVLLHHHPFSPSSPELQLHRLVARDKSAPADAHSRLNSQLSITSKVAYADLVIDNSGSLTDLDGEVMSCLGKLERAVGWGWMVSWLFPPVGLLSAVWCLSWRAFKRRNT